MEMRAGSGRWRGALGLWLAAATAPAAAQVGPLTYQNLFFDQASNVRSGNYLAADAGFVYTDNATFVGNGAGDTVAEIGLIGNSAERGPRLDYHLDADIAAVKYLNGSYPLEPTGYLDASGDFKIVPGAFNWQGRETYTQLVINPYLPVTPNNLENLNTITTGPRFILRPTLRTTVTLDGIFSYVNSYSPSPLYVNIDNHRYGGDLKIERAFNSAASVYVRGVYEKVYFNDQAINNNFTAAEGLAGYRLAGERTFLDVSGGYTQLRELNVEVPVQSIVGIVERPMTRRLDAANWAFTLSRVLTPSQRLELFASQQLLDAATLFQADLDQAVPTIAPPQVAVGDPVTNRIFGADWHLQGPRTSLDVGLLDTRQRYALTTSENRDLKDASLVVVRQLSPVLHWDVGLRFERQDLVGARSVDATSEITNLRWRIGGRVVLRFLYAHSTFAGISDNQFGAFVSYVLLGAGGGAAPSGATPTPFEPTLSPYGLQPVSPMSTLSPPR